MPTTIDKVEKWSLPYYLLKKYVDWGCHFYFKTTVEGLDSLPKNKSLIFAPNHQNALMDALNILCVQTWQPVFLARADIFKQPTLRKILIFLKIMPVYRMRDGYENLQNNDETFNKTIDVLRNQNGLAIMPEGNHGHLKKLRPLKKGIARIAFQAMEADPKLDIEIVPVGLDYTNYIKVGSKLHIRFGVPISVKPYKKIYKNNPARAYNLLIRRLEEGLKPEMINIEDEKYYSVYKILTDSFTNDYLRKNSIPTSHANAFKTQKDIIDAINNYRIKHNDDFLLLAASALEYKMLITRRKLDPTLFPMTEKQRWELIPSAVGLAAFLPLFLLSFINIFPPVAIANLVSRKFEDKQFLSSVRFAIAIILTPLFFVIQLVVFALITKSVIYTIAYSAIYPLCFYVTFIWKIWATKFAHRLRELRFNVFEKKKTRRIYELYENIFVQLERLLNLPT
ncbi:MAG: 1-acyl-sn-glycerol-3-phosphate acyltransferase [Tenuifilaceae bacterium]|nr:1-acyl-sn-glycerol-3-phosphate acyltransferase [Tenuifilaceae bacterium]